MKQDRHGRLFCKVEDQDSGLYVELSPDLYDVLYQACHERLTGTVELNFNDGNIVTTHIRISGSKWLKPVPKGIGALIPGSQRREAVEGS